MIPIREWVKSDEVQRLKKMPLKEVLEVQFFRDPIIPIFYDRSLMYSPANGIILYIKELSSADEIVTVKGKSLTLKELMEEEVEGEKFIVIGIFMTFYDVHINKMPTSGFLYHKLLSPLKIENLSMLKIEESILEGHYFDHDDLEYLFCNARMLNTIFSNAIGQEYYIIQIADLEVNMIVPFNESGEYLNQCSNFSMVRYGSQVDLIVPMKKGKIYDCLVKDKILYHVEAGRDPLIKIR